VFGVFAGIAYWFPKAFGFRLHEGWGKATFWLALAGFYVVFMPLYVTGLLGMTRRLQHYDVAAWRPWLLISAAGMILMTASAACQVTQLVVSIRRRHELRDETGDPWDGRSLEWATASPPPACNFVALPVVGSKEPLWEPAPEPSHVSGLATDSREGIATTVVDALPDHRYAFPTPSIWPFIAAIATTVMFIASIFTPWAVVWGSIPIAIALIAWFWPTPQETEKHLALEKRP
jgi:cytochrome c oxidase subunit I+III